MTNNFSLFRLPYVALYEVLDNFGPATILSLSLCSKRAKLIMKNYRGPSKKVNIAFDIDQCALKVDHTTLISVMIVCKHSRSLERVTIGPCRVPVYIRNGILKTYWNDEKVGMEAIIKYTLDVFNGKLHSLISRDSLSSTDLRFWIKWIKKFQVKIQRMSVLLNTDYQNQLMNSILESDFVTGDLELFSRSLFDLWGPRPDPRPYSIDFLKVEQSSWVTLDHLLAMDIKRIFLTCAKLTYQDINVFLKRWIKGECSKRIKEISLDIFRGIEVEVLFNNIEVTRRDPNLIRCYVGYKSSEQFVSGFDIRRESDGAMATIIYMFSGLKVLFWPDNEGNPYH